MEIHAISDLHGQIEALDLRGADLVHIDVGFACHCKP